MRLKVREFCVKNGISMRELGRRIGMKISILSRINTGKVCVTVATLDRIANALNTDYNSLIEGGSAPGSGNSMEIFQNLEGADGGHYELTPAERAQLADEKGKELLARQNRLAGSGMEIRKCF